MGEPNGFNTFSFGHPRQVTLDRLSAGITRKRQQARDVMAATKARSFHHTTISKAIYATAWDGTVRVVADTSDQLTVFREH